MAVFRMMIGLPYSGKDYYIEHHKMDGEIVISSDAIRKYLWDNESCQDDPKKIFKIMQERAYFGLALENNVWYNATNLTMKDRHPILQKIRQKLPDVKIEAIVMAPSLETIEKRMVIRERKVPPTAIKKMLKRWETPMFFEGFDEIQIECDYNMDLYTADDIMFQFQPMPHDNPHHSLSIYNHMRKAFNLASANNESMLINRTLYYHDIGKFFTKTFTDAKGNKTEEAHFYGHANYGAYIVLAYDYLYRDKSVMKLIESWLINFHMKFFDSKGIDNWASKYNVPKELLEQLQIIHHYGMEAH